MIHDQSIPVTMTIIGRDHTLCEATVIIVRVMLHCALAGVWIRHFGSRDEQENLFVIPALLPPATGPVIDCGIIPVKAGTASRFTRLRTDIR
jgi:hypothetical protein